MTIMLAPADRPIRIQHRGTPPAPCTRPQVYAASWNRLIRRTQTAAPHAKNARWSTLSEREALVASRFAAWLGSDDGSCFLATAEAIISHFRCKPDAYAAAWAAKNSRDVADGNGWRLLERLMVEQYIGATPLQPHLTLADYEIAECVAAWLGTGEGQLFIACNETLAAPREFNVEKFNVEND